MLARLREFSRRSAERTLARSVHSSLSMFAVRRMLPLAFVALTLPACGSDTETASHELVAGAGGEGATGGANWPDAGSGGVAGASGSAGASSVGGEGGGAA